MIAPFLFLIGTTLVSIWSAIASPKIWLVLINEASYIFVLIGWLIKELKNK